MRWRLSSGKAQLDRASMPPFFLLTRPAVPLSMPKSLFPGTTTGDVGHALNETPAVITSYLELLPT